MRVELAVFVAAILWSLVSKLLAWRSPRVQIDELPSIFVGIVAYRDPKWPEQVEHLLATAAHPARLSFGVVEYVEDADDTIVGQLPAEWRHVVRVYTVSQMIASSQRVARRLCFDETHRDETYVLFARGWAPVADWDEILVNMVDAPNNVISTRLHDEPVATFPCVDARTREIASRELRNPSARAVTSLLWQSDLVFCGSAAVEHVLSSSDEYEVSAALVARDYALYVPGCAVGSRHAVPRGVKAARKQHSKQQSEYAKRIGVHADRVEPTAVLGLHREREAAESIAKYGSVMAARVAYQSEKYAKRRT